MKTTKKEAASLWNIVIEEAVANMNCENTIRFEKAIERFRKRLDTIVNRHVAKDKTEVGV